MKPAMVPHKYHAAGDAYMGEIKAWALFFVKVRERGCQLPPEIRGWRFSESVHRVQRGFFVSFGSWLFPEKSRFLPGHRWLNIGLRTLHLLGIAGLGAGFLYAGVDETWRDYFGLTLFSGMGLSLLFLWSNGIWLIQLRGQLIFLKVGLLAAIALWPEATLPLFVSVILISGLISHAPADLRYYSLYHRRRIETL